MTGHSGFTNQAQLSKQERAFNLIAGLSVFSWAVMGLLQVWKGEDVSLVRISVSALNFVVAGLFIFRGPIRAHCSKSQIAQVLGSFLGGALAFRFALELHEWPDYAAIPFAVGTAIAACSLIYLGRSFAVLPALRTIIVRGPYKVIRHPAYFGELIMIGCCCATRMDCIGAGLMTFNVMMVAVRIRVEEAVLRKDEAYVQYSERVRWRLAPGIW
ncbi:MAG: isoprenylcysteine carboxylmethyltransferase family protein [Verrucomicrobiota bacterium]